MSSRVHNGNHKYFCKPTSDINIKKISNLECIKYFKSQDNCDWSSYDVFLLLASKSMKYKYNSTPRIGNLVHEVVGTGRRITVLGTCFPFVTVRVV